MPVFEFRCKNCGARFDYLVRGSADVPECPSCRGRELEKLISGFAFNSKGKESLPPAAGASSCSGCSGGDCSSCSR